MNAVARTTPPWNPPDGLVCACEARNQPITTTGPVKSSATRRTASLAGGIAQSAVGSSSSCCRSLRRWRSTTAIPAAATNRMNSSPTVSNPRYEKLTAETTPVALVWATATRLMMSPYGPG